MLPPFIIDQIRRREEQEQEVERQQPRIELPLPERRSSPSVDEEPQRGVVIIDLA